MHCRRRLCGVPALSPYVDTHVHFDGDAQAVVQAALQALGRQNAAKLFFMSPPDTFDTPNRLESDFLLPLVRQHSDKLAILAGGGTLNAMIQQSVKTGDSGAEVQKRFRERAEEILRMGGSRFRRNDHGTFRERYALPVRAQRSSRFFSCSRIFPPNATRPS